MPPAPYCRPMRPRPPSAARSQVRGTSRPIWPRVRRIPRALRAGRRTRIRLGVPGCARRRRLRRRRGAASGSGRWRRSSCRPTARSLRSTGPERSRTPRLCRRCSLPVAPASRRRRSRRSRPRPGQSGWRGRHAGAARPRGPTVSPAAEPRRARSAQASRRPGRAPAGTYGRKARALAGGRRRRRPRVVRGRAELFARVDPELREHSAQVPLDRPRADEELCADLGIRAALGGEACDLRLLRGEPVTRVGRALAHSLAGRHPLTSRAFSESVHAGDLRPHPVRDPEMLTSFGAPALASQPLAVDQVSAGEGRTYPRAAQTHDRLAIQLLGNVALAEQRARARLDAERPVRAGGPADLLESAQRAGCALGMAAACGRLDELGVHPRRHTQLLRMPYALLGGGERLLVTAEAVEENGAGPLGDDEPEALAAIQHLAPPGVDQRSGLSLLTA